MFCRKKLGATEARIIAHIGLQKKRAKQEKEILEMILSCAKHGHFSHIFDEAYCEPHKPMLSMLNYVCSHVEYDDYDYFPTEVRTIKRKGIKVSWE